MITEKDIERFISEAHRVGDAGLTICSSGNLSWRIGEEVLLSATGSWVPNLRKDQVAICNLSDGRVINGVRPSMESVFHFGVLRERPDCNVVLHFQSPYATALACMKTIPDINMTAEVSLYVGAEIPVIPFVRPGSPELAEKVIDALADHNACFLRKHGQVVCGKDFDDAFQRAMFFEMGCRLALMTKGDSDPLTSEEIDDLETYFLAKHK
ncbi:MAG: class II aldolase/adducin family protein [Muribaculaceae bacterium]|nr:class II aldolase/adducin family protein [Muribaculaceae bacterium]